MSVRIRFKGKEYWFIGDEDDTTVQGGGCITLLEDCNAEGDIVDWYVGLLGISYAYYYPGRGVLRLAEKIGDREDIEIVGKAE